MKTYVTATLTIAIILLSLKSSSTCATKKITNDSTEVKALKLKRLYSFCVRSPELREIYQKQFFDEFPSTFTEFDQLYGYSEITGKGNILYLVSDDHINVLFKSLGIVNDTLFYKKVVKIAVNGKWDADAVNFFQHHLREIVENNVALLVYILRSMEKKSLLSFWYFYFDEPYPEKKLPEPLQKIKLIDSRIYNLMVEAQKEVLKQPKE